MRPLTVTMPGPAMQSDRPGNLREACQEFESLLIGQMLQAMRKTVPETGLPGKSEGEQIFRDMMDRELARDIARSGSFGISDIIYRQLAASGAAKAPEKGDRDENR